MADDDNIQDSTILVADDDPELGTLVRSFLLKAGYRVELVEDGEAALKAAKSGQVDLMLLDVMMPGLTGPEVCRQMKMNPELHFIPVVLMTALDDPAAKSIGLEAGADDFVNKPVDLHELTFRVKTLLKTKSVYTRFREAYKMQALSHLAAGVAHNLKNIMNGLLLDLEVAKPEVAPDVGEVLDAADAAGRRVVEIIDLLMLFARAYPMQNTQVDLAVLAQNVARICTSAFDDSIEISVEIPAEPATVTGDPVQLEQAVLNLMFNARDAIEELEEGGRRWIGITVQAAAQGRFELRVSDSGGGIDEAVREHLFEPFFTTKPNDGGIGLGLATVQDVVQQHHGTVEAEPGSGSGTTFTLSLPASG